MRFMHPRLILIANATESKRAKDIKYLKNAASSIT
jgi:hypothetical protein